MLESVAREEARIGASVRKRGLALFLLPFAERRQKIPGEAKCPLSLGAHGMEGIFKLTPRDTFFMLPY